MALFSNKPENEEQAVTYAADPTSTPKAKIETIPVVLIQPRISEKAGHLAALNKYVFNIKTTANKVDVKKAVEGFYKVHVMQVNIVRNIGKQRRFGPKSGTTSGFKKAIVTLKPGDKIEGLTDVV